MANIRQITKKELVPLIKSLNRFSKFLETATDTYTFEWATIREHPKVGVLLEFVAGDEDGNEVDLQIWNLSPTTINYGVGEKRSRYIKDWIDFGVKGDSAYLYPLYAEIIKQLTLLKVPVGRISWDVLGACRGVLDKPEIHKSTNKVGEFDLVIGVKTPEGE